MDSLDHLSNGVHWLIIACDNGETLLRGKLFVEAWIYIRITAEFTNFEQCCVVSARGLFDDHFIVGHITSKVNLICTVTVVVNASVMVEYSSKAC